MSDEKTKGLNISGIKEAANQMKKLSEQMDVLKETFRGVQTEQLSFAEGMLEMVTASIEGYEAIHSLCSIVKTAGEYLKTNFDTKVIQKFSEAVTLGAMSAGDGIEEYKESFSKLKEEVVKLPQNAKELFGSLCESISGFGRSTKESFTNLKTTISSFTFADLKAKVKELPHIFDTGIKSAGQKLYENAGTIGNTAGKLLSVGLTGGIALAAAAVTTLIASFSYLMDSNEAFREKVTEAWGQVKEAFQPAIDAFNKFKETLFGAAEADSFTPFVEMILEGITGIIEFIAEVTETVSEFIAGFLENLTGFWTTHGEGICETMSSVWGSIKDTVSTVWETISAVVSGVIEVLKAIWTEYGEEIMATVSAVWEFISGIVLAAKEFITGAIDIVVGIFTLNGDKIREGAGKLWEGMKELFSTGVEFIKSIFEKLSGAVSKVFEGIVSFFEGLWGRIKKVFTTIGTKVGNAMGGAFKAAVNGVISFAQRTINGFIGSINRVIGLINKIPGVSVGRISTVSLPRLASGGIVDAGQMFIARERGPELVGTFGSRSAVMNNSQIVEAVSRGVYEAVRSAMGGEGAYTFNISNHLDGREIGRQVIKYHNGIVKQTGRSPLYV